MHTLSLIAVLLGSCSCSTQVEHEPEGTPSQSSPVIDEAFVPRLLEIAAGFKPDPPRPPSEAFFGTRHKGWSKLGDVPSWAPELCSAPPVPGPLVSDSGDEGTHGRKLYYLYTRDVPAYLSAAQSDQPIGQAFVKESYGALAVSASDAGFSKASYQGFAVEREGQRWKLGPARDLFVMYKLDPSTPGTDQGWVYGTVSPELQVTSAGRVASCMECHVDAKHDRMFGAKAERELAASGWDAWEQTHPADGE